MSGTNLKVTQKLMRHSDPKLTMGVYTHTNQQAMREAADGLPIRDMAGSRVYAGEENCGNGSGDESSDPAYIFDPVENACAVLAREHGKTRTKS
ncbi:hypothetical protein KS4_14940 [Poriferisphaera corsica]|uniref:Tyr recombinase domain-containing protein n=2 Tax=Poriferisphaera corsica TaxID=2528020 RepID=A0A517YT83_9BACT|nr:hypothetical protein KS4_14940 [Poriferisphaera corsica]